MGLVGTKKVLDFKSIILFPLESVNRRGDQWVGDDDDTVWYCFADANILFYVLPKKNIILRASVPFLYYTDTQSTNKF